MSVLAKYQDLDAESDRLALGEPAGVRPPAEARQAPTEVHRRTMALLDELLSIGGDEAGPFQVVTRTMRRLEPILLRDFATVPEDKVRGFLELLGGRLLEVAHTGRMLGAVPDLPDTPPAA